ncbi:PEP/pyruvate-binding domain-containing protein [Pseudarthrobacter sulfonivorans]|uniref:PEP/pyruvate-binding domain-containing protein n=1 Tax=Pseudarthrobacter sulfonivorans TaxID=121292 RepID=UPI0021053A93|nr:PEP/pyruvate-binding domain-containing protein [Pseudarthrobacter sulfonivorans]
MAGDGSPILDLQAVTAAMVPVVGGKAANLGELLAAGLPVPDGFCLTTAAYRQATAGTAAGGALAAVHQALKSTNDGDLTALAALAGQARDAIRSAPVPPDIAAAIEDAYSALGNEVPVAVRSSATAEDLPSASFAGQQDTYLNVVGAAAVVDAVRDCWASLWTDRAVSYRATRGIDPSAVALAVVVQRMVDANAAGVLFTSNPLTNRRREAVIDASPGLGEAVVSGAVNPDHFVVDPVAGRVLERRLGDKRIAVRPLSGGGTRTVAASNGGATACLSDRQAADLAVLGLRVEGHFGAPQDIEWAIDAGGRLWLTQSRPITTLFPVPQRPSGKASAAGTRVYLCLSLAQGLTRPITPMGLAAFRVIASSVARAAHFDVPQPHDGPSPYAEAAQRIYFDLTAIARSTTGRRIVPRVFDVMEARSATLLRQIFEDPRFSVTRRTPLSLLRHVLPVAARARVPETLVRAALKPEAALRRANRQTRDFGSSLQPPAGATPLQRLDHAEHILGNRLFSVVPSIIPLPALGFAALGLVGRLLGGDRWDDLQIVLRGLPNNVTTEMDLELWRFAQVIKDDGGSRTAMTDRKPAELAEDFKAGRLPTVLQAGLARFMDQYGHRAVAEIDVGMPRWSDDPTHIIGVLANYLRLTADAVPPDVQFSNAAEEAEARIAQLVAEANARGRLHGALVKAALRRARLFAGLRELPKFQLVVALAEVRKQLGIVGAALAAAGVVDTADDVFFLNLDEARAGLLKGPGTGHPDLRGVVAGRRAAYDLELARRHVPRVLLSDGTEPEAVQPAGSPGQPAGSLTGSPASAGTVTAAARVIMDPVGAHLEPGEILVAPSTDPGWTPLFLTAGGLVMEMGGPNSHGAVVAREYGIPAVVGVPDATLRLATGQQITVDGGAGTVVPS